MSIKNVLIALLALCLMIGCVAGADCCRYDPSEDYDPIEPFVPFDPIDPHDEDVGQKLADRIAELLEYLFGGNDKHKLLTE